MRLLPPRTDTHDDRQRRDFALQVFAEMRTAGVTDISYDADNRAVRYDEADCVLDLAMFERLTQVAVILRAPEWALTLAP
ncbi:hypothetical protein [Nocardia sp. NPDC003963]